MKYSRIEECIAPDGFTENKENFKNISIFPRNPQNDPKSETKEISLQPD